MYRLRFDFEILSSASLKVLGMFMLFGCINALILFVIIPSLYWSSSSFAIAWGMISILTTIIFIFFMIKFIVDRIYIDKIEK